MSTSLQSSGSLNSSGNHEPPEEKIKDCIKYKSRQLDLSFCDPPLPAAPPSIFLCGSLEILYLVFNQLTELPPQIGTLVHLRELYVHYNKITKLPAEIGNLKKLQKFDASYNQLSTLPKELLQLVRLQELDLTENPLPSPLKELAAIGKHAVFKYLEDGTVDLTRQRSPTAPQKASAVPSPEPAAGEQAHHTHSHSPHCSAQDNISISPAPMMKSKEAPEEPKEPAGPEQHESKSENAEKTQAQADVVIHASSEVQIHKSASPSPKPALSDSQNVEIAVKSDVEPKESDQGDETDELSHKFFELGIPAERAGKYSKAFVDNGIDSAVYCHLDHELLKEIGVDLVGDRIKILQYLKTQGISNAAAPAVTLNEIRNPWDFTEEFVNRPDWFDKADGLYKSFEIFNEKEVHDEDMSCYIRTLFEEYFDGENFQLCKAFAIHNQGLRTLFETTKQKLTRRLEYEPNLFGKKTWTDEVKWREWVLARLSERTDRFPHNKNAKVKSIPVLQGLRNPEVAWKICQTGMASLSQLDDGYYGAGMYFTTSAEYAIDLYTTPETNGYRVLMMCWILLGNTFPCVENPKENKSIIGKPLKPPHDSHFAIVEKTGLPCTIERSITTQFFDEYVLKEESMVLPSFVLFIKKP